MKRSQTNPGQRSSSQRKAGRLKPSQWIALFAVAAIGYGDGYPRHARNGTPVLLNGKLATLLGQVSMDMITIDLREHEQARVGDQVTLWGEGLPLEDVAPWCDAIPWQLMCGVTARVKAVVF